MPQCLKCTNDVPHREHGRGMQRTVCDSCIAARRAQEARRHETLPHVKERRRKYRLLPERKLAKSAGITIRQARLRLQREALFR